jgi:hypothetical protein
MFFLKVLVEKKLRLVAEKEVADRESQVIEGPSLPLFPLPLL